MQAPGGRDEDPSGGFEFGGWTAPHSDEMFGEIMQNELQPADYLLGRWTFKHWESYWPHHGDFWPGINTGTKYVLSNTVNQSSWQPSIFLKNADDIIKVKNAAGANLHVWGSSELIQLLFQHDLVDELNLKIYPLTLGRGKKLFGSGVIPSAFTLTESIVTSKGVIIAYYKRAGEVETGEIEV